MITVPSARNYYANAAADRNHTGQVLLCHFINDSFFCLYKVWFLKVWFLSRDVWFLNKYPAAWGNNWFARKMIIKNYKCYFLIHCKISQHIRLQSSNYKEGSVSQESSRLKAIERMKRRAGSRAAMASIAARSNIVIFLKGVLVIL